MKKVIFLVFILCTILYGQTTQRFIPYGSWTRQRDSLRVTLVNADSVYMWFVNPSNFNATSTQKSADTSASTSATKPSTVFIPFNGENYWNGNFYLTVYPTVVSGTCDTLEVIFQPFDNVGKVVSNDVRYLDFSTATASSTAKRYTSVTTLTYIGACSNGEGVPLSGYRIRMRQKGTCRVKYDVKFVRN